MTGTAIDYHTDFHDSWVSLEPKGCAGSRLSSVHMRIGLLLFALGLVVAGAVALPYARESLAVDSCLDTGGSFNYDVGVCDHNQNHPYVPFTARHTHAVPTLLTSFALVVLGQLLRKRSV